MPVYNYVAKDRAGRTVRGRLEAPDTEAMRARLREDRLFLMRFSLSRRAPKLSRMNSKDLADFNRQLGAMLSAGISLMRAFEILLRRDVSQKHRAVYQGLYTELIKGVALSDAMEAQGKVFPPLLVSMYRAAEAGGSLDVTALQMAEHYKQEHQLNGKVRSAAMYPLVLLVLTVLVLIVVFTFVLPTFMDLYGGMELPLPTRVVLAVSGLFTDHLLLLVGAVLLVVIVARLLLAMPGVRIALDRLKLKAPLVGPIMRTITTARFARTLSALYSSGLPILTALEVTRSTLLNAYIDSQFDALLGDVRTGNPLADALKRVDGLDPQLASSVAVGEESGRLGPMLVSVADAFDFEAGEAAQRLVSVLEPLLIVVMAVVVGFVMVAVLMPIYGMYDQIGAGL